LNRLTYSVWQRDSCVWLFISEGLTWWRWHSGWPRYQPSTIPLCSTQWKRNMRLEILSYKVLYHTVWKKYTDIPKEPATSNSSITLGTFYQSKGHIPEESYLKNILFSWFISSPCQNMALSSNVARNIPRVQ